MKKIIIFVLSVLAFTSCKKNKSFYRCECNNGYKTHFSSEYKIAKDLCHNKENAINDTTSWQVTCKIY